MSSKRPRDPFDAWMRFAVAWQETSMAAGEVMAHRSLLMSRGAMSAAEATGMVMEKATAFTTAGERATVAAALGGNPLSIAAAALSPIRTTTRSNARRLRG